MPPAFASISMFTIAVKYAGAFFSAFCLVHGNRNLGRELRSQFLKQSAGLVFVHQAGLNESVESAGAVVEIGVERLRQLGGSIGLQQPGAVQPQAIQSLGHLLDGRDFDLALAANGVANFLADRADISPERPALVQKCGVWSHFSASSRRRMNSGSGMPMTWQTSRNSRISRRRSPDSYLLTNDCG